MNEQGFLITHRVVSTQQCRALVESLEGIPRTRAGARHLLAHPEVIDVATNLLPIANGWFRATATPFRATLFEKTPTSNWNIPWHQDTALPVERRMDVPGWGPWSEKAGITYAHAPGSVLTQVVALRLSLDDSTPDNGPLRVIPTSHQLGLLTDDDVLLSAKRLGETTCCVPAGAVLVMSPLLIHASSKATTDKPRRVLHIEYATTLDFPPLRLQVT